MNRSLSMGYSPCPNDTFIFYGLVHGKIDCRGVEYMPPLLEDVETLNTWALLSRLDITKLSFHALGHVLEDYCVLSAGSALGRGCGPLLIAKKQVDTALLREKRIAIPGEYTTAALLLRMFLPGCTRLVPMRFDRIMAAVSQGDVDGGVIIHESRFTYDQFGLVCLQDLGQWWEEVSGMPIPLGAIAAKRSLGKATIDRVEQAICESVQYAFAHPEACSGYIRCHSQEMEEDVVKSHIGLYVNNYSIDLGKEGFQAVDLFLERGRESGALPEFSGSLRFA